MAVDQIIGVLCDGLDHPELWPLLEAVVAEGDHAPLLDLLRKLHPMQLEPAVVKAFEVAIAMLHGFAVDRGEGLAMLERLESRHGGCPMVAGALFYVTRAGDNSKSADLSQKFCDAPFVKFETLVDGTVAPCCSIWTNKRLGSLDGQTFEGIWNSADAQDMRASILDGSFRHCNKRRCTMIAEDTLPARDAVTDPRLRSIIDEGKVVLDTKPNWLFLAHDWTCNLACPSCRSKLLGASEEQEARFEKIERDVFRPLLAGGDRLLVSASGQGDPWSSQHYRSLLRFMADEPLDLKLNIHTNALLMGEKKWAEYLGLERYEPLVDVSIDACTPWVYEYVRRPGKWDKLELNLRFIAAKRAAGVFREYHLNATVQLDNYHELPAMVDFAKNLGADSMRLYMIQNTGGHIAADYPRKNVADQKHPLHLAFLETLRDARLGDPAAHLYDVAAWRKRAFETTLPSDTLGEGAIAHDFDVAIADATERGEHALVVALSAGAAVRCGATGRWLLAEAQSLDALGFARQAEYRRKAAEAMETLDQAASALMATA